MRGKKAKEIRRALNIGDGDLKNPIIRRIYRRIKKNYNATPRREREAFIKDL